MLERVVGFLLSLVRRQYQRQILYPKSYEDILEILRQAKDNGTSVKTTGGTFPLVRVPHEIILDLSCINRLIGLDVHKKTVIAESGMKLSALNKVLESVHLTLDLYGRVPDLALCDALAAGLFAATSDLMAAVQSVQVCMPNGRIVTWSWDKDGPQMRAVCCGLGMIGVVLSITFKCVPSQRFMEISYLCSIRDVLENFDVQCKSSSYQQLHWFPLSELAVLTHFNPTDNILHAEQPLFNALMEKIGCLSAMLIRALSRYTAFNFPFLTSVLGRMQFFTVWSMAKQRSDFSHSSVQWWAYSESCRGSAWQLPLDTLPDVLNEVYQWVNEHPACCVSPIFIQTSSQERSSFVMKTSAPRPFLLPIMVDKHKRSCQIWYDWFVPESNPDPIDIHYFESIFLSVGGVRCWSGERMVSPLVLTDSFPYYRKWCKLKAELDPDELLSSSYVQGTIFTHSVLASSRSRSTWSECSSICGSVSSLIM